MYLLVLLEFIEIVALRKKLKRDNTNDDNNPPPQKDILKVDVDKKEELSKVDNVQLSQINNIVEEKLVDSNVQENEEVKTGRKGSLEKNVFKADGIKLVDLDKSEETKDELTFNIFENLSDEDIKKMLNDQIDNDK